MDRLTKLLDTLSRLNPDAGEIGAGMLANIVSEAKAIQLECDSQGAPKPVACRYRHASSEHWSYSTAQLSDAAGYDVEPLYLRPSDSAQVAWQEDKT